MSLVRSFSTKKYYGSVTLGSGDIQVKIKEKRVSGVFWKYTRRNPW